VSKSWEQPSVELPFDFNEATGVREYFSMREDGGFQLRQEMPIDYAALEASKALAKDPDHWKNGVKKEFVHYAHIDDAILFLWYTMGVNINEPKELLDMVNRPEWSYLKCTGKVHT
jgi:hypothetical protein